MRIVKSNKAVKATEDVIVLTDSEKKELRSRLYDMLDFRSEYHSDLTPTKKMDLQELMDAFFYWGDEYNDGYLGFTESECEDKLDQYLLQEFKVYRGEGINACNSVKATKQLSAQDQALQHIKAAIDILGKSGMKDDVTKDSIANLGVVMFDLKGKK